MINKYDDNTTKQKNNSYHHSKNPSSLKRFLKDVNKLTHTIDYFGNPFAEDCGELISLDSKIVSDSKALYEFETKGKEKYS